MPEPLRIVVLDGDETGQELLLQAVRVLDPELAELERLLVSESAPTWLVSTAGANAWGLDEDGSLRRVVGQRYRQVAVICDQPVWLHRDADRGLAPPP